MQGWHLLRLPAPEPETEVNLYCDNYRTCNSMVLDQGSVTATVARARARGWHLYQGASLTQKDLNQALCEGCVGTSRKVSKPQGPLPGQLELEWEHDAVPDVSREAS